MTHLLDSNVWIAALRKPGASLAMRFRAKNPADLRVCIQSVGGWFLIKGVTLDRLDELPVP